MTIREATLAARQRTGNPMIGTTVKQAVWSVVTVEATKRSSKVTTLATGLTMQGAIDYLNSI